MRTAKGKTYQDYTFALSIPLELDVDDLVLLKMEHFLCCSCSRSLDEDLRLAPQTPWGTSSLNLSSSISDHRGWQASSMRSSRDGASWACPYSYLLEVDPSLNLYWSTFKLLLSSWFQWHKAIGNLFNSQPWDQHMAQATPMDKPTSETQFTH